jgi:hypothetical protein
MPHDAQHDPQPAQPPQRQARQPHPLQPLQPRQPPQRQPQAICCTPVLPAFSLSKRWNVARLTSAISSSPRVNAWAGSNPRFCGASKAGTADADALPASEKVNPAAPSAGMAAFVTLFRFEACFTRDIVASSIPVRSVSIPALMILRKANLSRKTIVVTNVLFYI